MEIVPKLPDWVARLDAFVAETTRLPFTWGEHDCALFADGAFEAQTGVSFAAEFKGRYSSFEEALTLLQAAGFEDHVALVGARLPEIPIAFSRIGDIAAVDFGGNGLTLMVVAGHRLIGPMPHMRGSVGLTRGCRAWAVGRRP